VAAGFNSIGIQSAGGAGKVLAEWIVNGQPPMDLWDVDIRRMMPFQRNRSYLHDRTVEALGLLYAMHWPFRQPESARGARKSPFHSRLEECGACYGETAGWERANWFAKGDQARQYDYSWKRQNWFDNSAAEHRAVRESVGVYDMTSFGKLRVEGKDAERLLNMVCEGVEVPTDEEQADAWAESQEKAESEGREVPTTKDVKETVQKRKAANGGEYKPPKVDKPTRTVPVGPDLAVFDKLFGQAIRKYDECAAHYKWSDKPEHGELLDAAGCISEKYAELVRGLE